MKKEHMVAKAIITAAKGKGKNVTLAKYPKVFKMVRVSMPEATKTQTVIKFSVANLKDAEKFLSKLAPKDFKAFSNIEEGRLVPSEWPMMKLPGAKIAEKIALAAINYRLLKDDISKGLIRILKDSASLHSTEIVNTTAKHLQTNGITPEKKAVNVMRKNLKKLVSEEIDKFVEAHI